MQTPAQLTAHLDSLKSELKTHVDFIATQLLKTTGTDVAGVTMRLRTITALTHTITQFLPSISAAQAADVNTNGPLSPAQAHVWAELNRTSFETRSWVNQWPQIETLIRAQTPPKRRKLYRNPAKTEDIILAQMALSDAAFEDLHQIQNPATQSQNARDYGCFADITLPNSVFLEHAHAAYRVLLAKRLKHPSRFLDVGSGSGFKVLTASRIFSRAHGLEYDQAYADQAQSLFDRAKSDTCHVTCADGLTYTNYNVYDVIYFYRPMRHHEQLCALERQIIQNAAPGTLIIAPYRMFESRYQSLGCARIAGQLYITATPQSAADDLRRKAEMTGPFIPQNVPRGTAIWDPIITASREMGFGI